ncbi:hypothetical protein [Nitrosospira sp. Nsp18]|nr:hypothetical protein [Nitrosospira sp. Nsp18]
MENPLSKLALDYWYQVIMVAGFAIFILCAPGSLYHSLQFQLR